MDTSAGICIACNIPVGSSRHRPPVHPSFGWGEFVLDKYKLKYMQEFEQQKRFTLFNLCELGCGVCTLYTVHYIHTGRHTFIYPEMLDWKKSYRK